VPFAQNRLCPEPSNHLRLEPWHLDPGGKDVKVPAGDHELAERAVAVEGNMRLAATGQPREIGLQSDQRGFGALGRNEFAHTREFDLQLGLGVHPKWG
jgi:hypothetical protein